MSLETWHKLDRCTVELHWNSCHLSCCNIQEFELHRWTQLLLQQRYTLNSLWCLLKVAKPWRCIGWRIIGELNSMNLMSKSGCSDLGWSWSSQGLDTQNLSRAVWIPTIIAMWNMNTWCMSSGWGQQACCHKLVAPRNLHLRGTLPWFAHVYRRGCESYTRFFILQCRRAKWHRNYCSPTALVAICNILGQFNGICEQFQATPWSWRCMPMHCWQHCSRLRWGSIFLDVKREADKQLEPNQAIKRGWFSFVPGEWGTGVKLGQIGTMSPNDASVIQQASH